MTRSTSAALGTAGPFRKSRLPVMRAAEAAECGLACLAMIARYLGHDVDLNGMRQRFPVSLAGTKLRALMDLAGQLGLATRALRADLDALSRLRTPAILHWDLDHFVVLKSARRGRVVIHDPALGRRVLDRSAVSKHFTGVVLELASTAAMTPVVARAPIRLGHLWSRIDGFWPALAQVLGLSLVLQVAVFAAPFYLQLSVDEAIATGDLELLAILALGFGGLVALRVGVTALRAWTLQSIGFLMSFQIVGNLVHHLLRLRTAFFEKRHVGDILSRVESVRPIQEALTQGVASTFIDGLMAFGAAVILFLYSPPLAMLVIGTAALGLTVTCAMYPAQKRRTEEQIVASAKAHTHLIESLRASTVVKLTGREAEREGLWRNRYADVMNATFAAGKLSIGMTAGQGLIAGVQTILVVYFAARQIIAGDGFTVGMLFAFMSYRQTFTDRCLALINQIIQFCYLRLHLDRLGDIVHAERDIPPASVALPPRTVAGRIDIRRLSFRYGSGDPLILDDVELNVAPGAFIAFTGPSGGGKSTLLKVMLGLYPPDHRRHPARRHARHARVLAGLAHARRRRHAGRPAALRHHRRQHLVLRSLHRHAEGAGGRDSGQGSRRHRGHADAVPISRRRHGQHALARPAPARASRSRSVPESPAALSGRRYRVPRRGHRGEDRRTGLLAADHAHRRRPPARAAGSRRHGIPRRGRYGHARADPCRRARGGLIAARYVGRTGPPRK